MKKYFIFLLLLMPMPLLAESDIIIDGIHFLVIDENAKKCKVVKDTENTGYYTASNYSGLIVIPSTINVEGDEFRVTKIDDFAFYKSKITFITLPNTIESIGDHAFDGCNSLEKINLPEKISLIPKYCFAGCENLKSIEIPDEVKSISEGSFQYSGLKSISLPDNIISIGDFSFSEAKALESINIPESCYNIGSAVFRNSLALNNIKISDNHPYFELSDQILYTKDYTSLYYCIPSNSGNIKIDNRTTTIINSAFYGCKKIKDVEFNEGLETIESLSFANCTGINKIVLPRGLIYLGGSVFENCSSLKTINIPNTVIEIGGFCFVETSISEITIPGSVERIGDKAFYLCNNLKKVNIRGLNPPERTSYLFPPGRNMEVHVLKGCKKTYESSTYWNEGTNIYDDLEPIKVERINILKDEYNIQLNETKKAIAVIYPDDADATITWSSSNESVVYIDKKGMFIGISEGEAEIIAISTDKSEIKASAIVRVGNATRINSLSKSEKEAPYVLGIYDLNGRMTNAPKPGLYIIRKRDGSVQKRVVK